MFDNFFIPINLAGELNRWINYIVVAYGDFFHDVANLLLTKLLVPLENLLMALPAPVVLVGVAVVSYFGSRKIVSSLLFALSVYVIGCLGLWEKTVQTLAIMIASLILTIAGGVPVGILMASNKWVSRVITPILDVMQTFPLFVYMLPAVMLFSIGKVPAVMATVIYAAPPLIRLTEFGIRHIDSEISEAGRSFGANYWQTLLWINLPLARPSIMAGINQATMMALAMTVVASMIGANGLGEDILGGLTNLDFGKGATAGVAVVILAIVIDRITQSYGVAKRQRKSKRKTSGAH